MVSEAATWGQLAACVVHDLEDLLTMPGWAHRAVPRLGRLYPWLPARAWSALDRSTQVAVAVGLMGVLVAVAAVDGARTDGRSVVYQVVLAGFGIHSVFHLGQTIFARGYTPGLVTAPLVVAPFSLWAWQQLDRAGVVTQAAGPTVLVALLLVPPVLLGVHALAGLITTAGRAFANRYRESA